MSTSRVARVLLRRGRIGRTRNALRRRAQRWRKGAHRVFQALNAAPPALRIFIGAALLVAAFSVINLAYQVVRKPTEMFFPVSGALNKLPAETWRQYGPLFREYASAAITPELLAALAQVESSGNPLARTYWRLRLSWDPFAIYQPATSAVGMYQMTDAAFDEARRYCVREHAVVAEGCWFSGLYSRVLPSHAVELTTVYLDRNVAAILARQPELRASPQQKQALAAMIHLCGAGPAQAFARRGFHPLDGERCGDHEVATYLARVDAMKRQFRRLDADR